MPYASLDLETTGLDPETDEIIEVAAIRFDASGVLDTYQTLVNPGRKLEYRIAMLTHIDPATLDAAPHFSSVAAEVERFIGLDAIVGQNPTFDTTFLARKGLQIFGPTYDTFELAGLLLPDLRQHTLGAIADHLGLEFTNRHRAMADADAAMRVFAALRQRLVESPPELIAEVERIASASDWTLRHLFQEIANEVPWRTGDIERRLQGVRQVRVFLVESGVQALTSLTQLLAAVVLMFVYSWTLALVYLATMPLYAGLMRFSAKRLRPVYDSLEEAFGKYQSAQIDAIRGIETVKALAAEREFRGLMRGQFQGLADRVFRSQFLMMIYDGGLQLISLLSFALFLFVGAIQVVHGDLTLGRFVGFNALVALANAPVLILLLLWDETQMVRVLLGRLDDVIEHEPEQGRDHSKLRAVSTLSGRVELRNVGFRYGGEESPPILDGVTFSVEPGESVAIVGRSGSGKTTLIKLLAGLMEPSHGAILYDGLELATLDYRTLRRQVGFVLQESYLFDDTIARNIAFGEAEPDGERVRWAARAANAHEFVSRLPLGYETKVGDSGLRLSGGQKQRIAIARALYNRPPILLFDEATSSLDTESERAVKESLDELLAERTSFVIAHRLSTIRDANRILVLERGRLVEEGTHDELMARQGLYFYLASQQLEL